VETEQRAYHDAQTWLVIKGYIKRSERTREKLIMADINSVTFTGRLTKDAVLKTLPTGTRLCNFSIANNTGWGSYAKTMYLEVNLWGKTGESLEKYLLKGSMVGVTGSLELQKWTSNQDGQEKQKLVISCRECILMGSKKAEPNSTEPEYTVYNDDEEIPL
jgi:single-strand DNA-binding protein